MWPNRGFRDRKLGRARPPPQEKTPSFGGRIFRQRDAVLERNCPGVDEKSGASFGLVFFDDPALPIHSGRDGLVDLDC